VTQSNHPIDRWTFAATSGLILAASLPLLFFPESTAVAIQTLYNIITDVLGPVYLWYAVGALGFLVYIAASRFGAVRLGTTDSKPEFATRSWVAMLFCTGVGAGLLYWAVIEWSHYLQTPPFGVKPRSTEAVEWAASYGLFHWGISAWAIYCLPTVAIGYAYHVRKVPYLRLSSGCMPYIGNSVQSKRGRLLDFLFMLNLIGGTGTSLGLSTPMIAASFARLTGLTHDFVLEVAMVALCIATFGTSAWLGLQKGIKRLSDLNMWVAITLLIFVLAVGPTLFILKMSTDGLGLMLQNFIRMSTWTDPVTNSRFVEDWTVFYWAWWIAYGPFVGIFVARISRGRSIREVIFGMLIYGSLGAFAFFMVFGNYAMHLELNGLLEVTSIIKQQSEATAIAEIIGSLPLGSLALALFFIIAVIFLVTTYDSASYTLASVVTSTLPAGEEPARWNRLFWAFALGVLPIALLFTEGGLRVVLSATIVASLPLIVVGVLLARSLLRMLQEDGH